MRIIIFRDAGKLLKWLNQFIIPSIGYSQNFICAFSAITEIIKGFFFLFSASVMNFNDFKCQATCFNVIKPAFFFFWQIQFTNLSFFFFNLQLCESLAYNFPFLEWPFQILSRLCHVYKMYGSVSWFSLVSKSLYNIRVNSC